MKKNFKTMLLGLTLVGGLTLTGCQSTQDVEETKESNYTISTEYKTGNVDEACAYKAFMNDNEREVFDKLVNLTTDYRKDVIDRDVYAKEMKKLYNEIENKNGFLASNMKDIVAKVSQTDLCNDEELDMEMDMLMNLVLTVEDDSEVVEENDDKDINKWICPVCGGTDCPEESECNNAADCLACGEFGVIGKDLEVWTNANGEKIITHKGECTAAMKEEAEAHKSVKCKQCGNTVSASDIVNGVCYDCNESNNEIDTNLGTCVNCGVELAPNGKCADCGYGY